MKMNLPVSNIGQSILVGDDYVHIENLVIQNPDLARYLSEVDISQQIPRLLKIVRFGTETFQFFSTTAAAEKLKAISIEITQNVGDKKKEIVEGIEGIATRLVSENDALSLNRLLVDWREDFSDLLSKNFDEKNKDSIISKFDKVLNELGARQSSDVIKRLDFNEPGSAVNLLQTNLKSHIADELVDVKKDLKELYAYVKGEEQAASEKKKQANRGKVFEDEVFELLEDIARSKGDIADNPGPAKKRGLQNNDEGDLTVQIDPKITGGATLIFVVECKLRQNRMSDKQLFDELDKGIANRGAKAGFIITEPKVSGLISADFFHEGSNRRAILDLNPTEPDINALRFAYLWARWQCLKDEATVLDSNAVKSALSAIRISLGTLITAKGNNTKAKGLLDANEGILKTLGESVEEEIEKLEDLIRAVEEDRSS